MDIVIVPGPGNGKELLDHLAWTEGARVRLAHDPHDIGDADLIVTPRGPSRSFSEWYQNDPVGQAVIQAHLQGTTWLAFCGSGLPLCSQLGTECHGVATLSLVAAKGSNNRAQGPQMIRTTEGRELPFHFTSAPTYQPVPDGEAQPLAQTKQGDVAILRTADLVLSSGIPATREGWRFLFDALEMPLEGARA